MDKETLSNYGWIVICILVLSVMIALATPFGNFIANGIKSTTEGLFQVEQKALGAAGLVIGDQSFEDDGGGSGGTGAPSANDGKIEYGVNDPDLNHDNGTTPQTGDTYNCGDYEYRYNQYYNYSSWETDESQNGWGVYCINNVADPGPILESINGKPVTNMYRTFIGRAALVTAPTIPSSVTNMDNTFYDCTALTTAPIIPNSVTSMNYTFTNCTALTTAPDMSNATSVTDMVQTFTNCTALTTAPIIPNSVTRLHYTFQNCTSLTTAPDMSNATSVTDMEYTFKGCTSLKSYVGSTAADGDFSGYVIPSSVTDMDGTFYNCTSLMTAPIIPSNVTDMEYTFCGCASLVNPPDMSNATSVTDMNSTFSGCTSLTTAPDMSNATSVTDMIQTFYGCTSLTGAITINSKPYYYAECLKNTQITEILGTCPDNIKAIILATK